MELLGANENTGYSHFERLNNQEWVSIRYISYMIIISF